MRTTVFSRAQKITELERLESRLLPSLPGPRLDERVERFSAAAPAGPTFFTLLEALFRLLEDLDEEERFLDLADFDDLDALLLRLRLELRLEPLLLLEEREPLLRLP